MVFGIRRMVHRFIRRNMSPVSVDKAEYWKKKLSFAYMLIGWNLFGVALFYAFTGRADWAYYYGLKTEEEASKRPGQYYAELLGMKNVHIITVEGFKKVGEYEYKGDEAEEEKSKSE